MKLLLIKKVQRQQIEKPVRYLRYLRRQRIVVVDLRAFDAFGLSTGAMFSEIWGRFQKRSSS
jgi:hypothetical protein